MAYSYCETNGLLGEIANMSSEREEIDGWIRYKITAGPGHVTVSAYFRLLEMAVKERKDKYNKLKNEPNLIHVTLCLYMLMEDDLPEKIVTETLI